MPDLAEENARLKAEVSVLTELNENLNARARLVAENARLKTEFALFGDETTRLSYQQAADWVRMANSITWSLGSIYVVAAIIALNGAMQLQNNQPWRTLIGLVVVFLCGAWIAIDWKYLKSTAAARKFLVKIEADWPKSQQPGFYQSQSSVIAGWPPVTALLYITAIALACVALLVAFPKFASALGLAL